MSTVDVFAPFKPAIDVNKLISQKGKQNLKHILCCVRNFRNKKILFIVFRNRVNMIDNISQDIPRLLI